MATRTKMTPFARLFLVLLFLVPAAYIVASYVNNEDPIANIKEMIGMEQSSNTNTNQQESTYDSNSNNSGSEIDQLRKENAALRRKVQDLEAQLRQLNNNSDQGNKESWGN